MKDLLVVVPSRGRPASIDRLQDAMAQTCRGDTTLKVGLDDDDPTAGSYRALNKVTGSGLRYVVAWINYLAMPEVGSYRFIGHFGDDNVPRTVGWDVRIMEALERTPFAYGEDLAGRPPGGLCCHVFTRATVLETLGYFGPPSIAHMYVDVAWYAWGRACGIAYLGDVIIEHLHYSVRRSPYDQTYAASYAMSVPDLSAWHVYSRDGLNADIGKLGGKPFTADELAAFNYTLNIPPPVGQPA